MLINGASGGVGSFAVQIAKVLGANVSAAASSAKLEYVKSLGAARVYDYRSTFMAQIRERFVVVLDVASTSSFAECVSPGIRALDDRAHFACATGGIDAGRSLPSTTNLECPGSHSNSSTLPRS